MTLSDELATDIADLTSPSPPDRVKSGIKLIISLNKRKYPYIKLIKGNCATAKNENLNQISCA